MNEELNENPFLQRENYFEGYNESIEALKGKPELVELDKLCYETFSTEMGKRFIQYADEHWLLPATVDWSAPNYERLLVRDEGFRYAFRMIKHFIKSHEQRIKAEVNKNVG